MERVESLIEKQICMTLHFRGVPQRKIALYVGKSSAYVNELLKPLGKKGDGEPE